MDTWSIHYKYEHPRVWYEGGDDTVIEGLVLDVVLVLVMSISISIPCEFINNRMRGCTLHKFRFLPIDVIPWYDHSPLHMYLSRLQQANKKNKTRSRTWTAGFLSNGLSAHVQISIAEHRIPNTKARCEFEACYNKDSKQEQESKQKQNIDLGNLEITCTTCPTTSTMS